MRYDHVDDVSQHTYSPTYMYTHTQASGFSRACDMYVYGISGSATALIVQPSIEQIHMHTMCVHAYHAKLLYTKKGGGLPEQ